MYHINMIINLFLIENSNDNVFVSIIFNPVIGGLIFNHDYKLIGLKSTRYCGNFGYLVNRAV